MPEMDRGIRLGGLEYREFFVSLKRSLLATVFLSMCEWLNACQTITTFVPYCILFAHARAFAIHFFRSYVPLYDCRTENDMLKLFIDHYCTYKHYAGLGQTLPNKCTTSMPARSCQLHSGCVASYMYMYVIMKKLIATPPVALHWMHYSSDACEHTVIKMLREHANWS